MGCGASSLKSSNDHRDDLMPKPSTKYDEVQKTSRYTRSNSGVGTDFHHSTQRTQSYSGDQEYHAAPQSQPSAEERSQSDAYAAKHAAKARAYVDHEGEGKKHQPTKKELREQAERRMAGRWRSGGQELGIAQIGFA